jgi:hypothetical protein
LQLLALLYSTLLPSLGDDNRGLDALVDVYGIYAASDQSVDLSAKGRSIHENVRSATHPRGGPGIDEIRAGDDKIRDGKEDELDLDDD